MGQQTVFQTKERKCSAETPSASFRPPRVGRQTAPVKRVRPGPWLPRTPTAGPTRLAIIISIIARDEKTSMEPD